MRTREEILKCYHDTTFQRGERFHALALEVLLDIRALLTPKEDKPEAEKVKPHAKTPRPPKAD